MSDNNIMPATTISVRNEGVTPGPWGCQQFGLFYNDAHHVGGTNWAQSKLMEYGVNFHAAKDLLDIVSEHDLAYTIDELGLPWQA